MWIRELGKFVVAAIALGLSAGVAVAEEHSALDVQAKFLDQRASIEKKLGDGKTYAEITSKERAEVQGALARISSALSSVESVDALQEDVKVAVFNDQALVNQILSKASEDSRVVCMRDVQTGSHRKANTCKTVAERRREREGSLDTLRRLTTPTSVKAGNN